jgi:uncharacterized protein (TIGR03435 family)
MPKTNNHARTTQRVAPIVQPTKLAPSRKNKPSPETHPRMKLLSLASTLLAATLLAAALTAPHPAHAQAADIPSAAPAPTSPQFAAATIKPPDPNARIRPAGFNGYPGGRMFYGGNVYMLVQYAFDLQTYQVTGGPDWARSEQFDISAVPPEDSPSRKLAIRTAEPTAEQRQMLQSLLRDRFGLKFHMETKDGEVYLLTRGRKSLQLKPPKNPDLDPRALIFVPSAGGFNQTADGRVVGNSDTADVIGYNTTIDNLARRLERWLELPVLNQTGITGAYDFDVPEASEINEDPKDVMLTVVDRLGLAIKRSRGPIQTLVIDHVDHPNAN